MENNVKKVSAARIRANKKYNAKTYKRLGADIKITDYNMIDSYCKDNNISKAKVIVNSIKYCIENNIDLTD